MNKDVPEITIPPMEHAELVGGIRDFLLDRLRANNDPRPWDQLDEGQQSFAIATCTSQARALVEAVVDAVAAQGRPTIKIAVKTVQSDGEVIKAAVTLPAMHKLRHELLDAAGRPAMLIVADADEFMGEGVVPGINPDQGSLDMGAHASIELDVSAESAKELLGLVAEDEHATLPEKLAIYAVDKFTLAGSPPQDGDRVTFICEEDEFSQMWVRDGRVWRLANESDFAADAEEKIDPETGEVLDETAGKGAETTAAEDAGEEAS